MGRLVYAAPLHRYAVPLRRWLRTRGYTVIATRPPRALQLLLEGKAAAATVPLASLLNTTARPVEQAPMVYTVGETMSSAVFSRDRRSLWDCPTIALTAETRTSAAYLALVLEDYRHPAKLVQGDAHTPAALLREAPCALLLGDQALRARAQGLHVAADIGELLWSNYRSPAVYAVTATTPPRPRPPRLRGPPWPRPTLRDAEETAKATGLDLEEATRYHNRVRLGYDAAALLNALPLLRRGAAALRKRLNTRPRS